MAHVLKTEQGTEEHLILESDSVKQSHLIVKKLDDDAVMASYGKMSGSHCN
jgi:hypothetical protein